MNVYTGVIESRDDPLMKNRVKVRVFGIHTESKADIPTDDLPWALVMMPTTTAGTSGLGQTPHGLVEGSWVVLFFTDPETKQDPIVIGSLASTANKTEGDVGFKDPADIYPTSDYVSESDVNKLARGMNTPFVEYKRLTKSAWPTASGQALIEPNTPYAPMYPLNKVMMTESGHVVEFDDTPDAERIHEYHRSGTFREIHPDGTTVTRIVGSDYEIVADSKNVYIKGACNVTVDQDCELYIKGDYNIRVDGNVSWYVGGSMNHTVENNHNMFVNGSTNKQVKINSSENVQGNLSQKVDGNSALRTVGNVTETVNGTFTGQTDGHHHLTSGSGIELDAPRIDLN